ncbi:MAG TPA: OsmC family protein [Anditalea sp.]|nr:OsmC family protein [Anditalea sp.]
MKTQEININGFDLAAISGTVEAIQNNPAIADFKWRANNTWITGGRNRSYIKDFYGGCTEDESREKAFIYENSEPPILLGANESANPVEFLLHGLAGCLTTTMALHAAAKGISIERISSTLEGDWDAHGFLGLDDQVRNGFKQIKVKFDIEGDLTEDQKDELISLACGYSPVYDMVSNGVPVMVARK